MFPVQAPTAGGLPGPVANATPHQQQHFPPSCQGTNSTVSDDFKLSLHSDNPPVNLPFEPLEACFCCREASWIWAARLGIIILFLLDIINHILGWRWEDFIQRKVAVATKHTHLGTRCAIGMLAMIYNIKMCWVD